MSSNFVIHPTFKSRPIERVAVIGAGAWGTALAITAERAGRQVSLWARETEVVDQIRAHRENKMFLPGIRLPDGIAVEPELGAALQDADLALLVVPSQYLRASCLAMSSLIPSELPIVICSKGVERDRGLLLSQVLEEALPGHPVAVLSGPTFAHEVASGMPTAVTVASTDLSDDPAASLAAQVALALGTPTFRPYVSHDVIGVEAGGAVKNVLAIASGIAHGLGLGSNARAALITRGLDEIMHLCDALGGDRSTVTGLAGLGDLTLTCSSEQSRNMRYGVALASGRSDADIFDGRPVVVEGRDNVLPVTELARQLDVDMPICEAVRSIVIDGEPIAKVMADLLSRPFRAEPRHIELAIEQPPDATGPLITLVTTAGARE